MKTTQWIQKEKKQIKEKEKKNTMSATPGYMVSGQTFLDADLPVRDCSGHCTCSTPSPLH